MDSWVEWLLQLRGNEFLVEVDAAYIGAPSPPPPARPRARSRRPLPSPNPEDSFNLYGLKERHNFRDCIDHILSGPPSSDQSGLAHPLFADSKDIYGLIHARFILSSKGLTLMVRAHRVRRARRMWWEEEGGPTPPAPTPKASLPARRSASV
jgi:hypothetical protein